MSLSANSMSIRKWCEDRELVSLIVFTFSLSYSTHYSRLFPTPFSKGSYPLCIFKSLASSISVLQIYQITAFTHAIIPLIYHMFIKYLLCLRHYAKFTISAEIRPQRTVCFIWILVFLHFTISLYFLFIKFGWFERTGIICAWENRGE